MIITYEIVEPAEETYCPHCGGPLYVGDTVYYSTASGCFGCCPKHVHAENRCIFTQDDDKEEE